MSDRNEPMNGHPEELLAGYVDGTLSSSERELVDRHLEGCETCQEEVALAGQARAALATLPELGAPGLAEAGVDALRRRALAPVPGPEPEPQGVRSRARRQPASPAEPAVDPRPRRIRIAWAQLAAAAAIIVVIGGLVAIPILNSGSGGQASREAAGAAPSATGSALPQLVDRDATYSPSDLEALAVQITKSAGYRASVDQTSGATPSPAALPAQPPGYDLGLPPVHAGAALADSSDAVACLIQGGAPTPPDATPLYLEEAAVSGTPAYIGAFFTADSKLHLTVVAVSREGCVPIYSVRQ
jgi:hypothetical protein